MRWMSAVVCLALVACNGGGDATPADSEAPDVYVDAQSGSDANDGSAAAPLRSITQAIAMAGSGATIGVRPGTYDQHETFPLQPLAGQTLLSLEPDQAMLVGSGEFEPGEVGVFLCLQPCRIIGFLLSGPGPNDSTGIVARDVEIEVEDCSFTGYELGVLLENAGSSRVAGSTFDGLSLGIDPQSDSDPVLEENTFSSCRIGIRLGGDAAIVKDNVFTLDMDDQVGVFVTGGSPRIEGNAFTTIAMAKTIGIYTLTAASAPVVRRNEFEAAAGIAVEVNLGSPDLGTAGDPGQNDFSLASLGLNHLGPATIQAVGNTWANAPPQAGQDYVLSGGGNLVL